MNLSLQLNLTAEIYRFTSSRPRFPDHLKASEQLHQLTLLSQFFAAAPKAQQIQDTSAAQMLVSTLGAIHALSNPLSSWQSIKGTFAFLGNRKGRLTPQLNKHIMDIITTTCAASAAGPVKEHMLQRSKLVKTGIRKAGGKKNFEIFGRSELATHAGTAFNFMDLTDIYTGSVALAQAQVNGLVSTYQVERKNTTDWEVLAKAQLVEMVNPVDEAVTP